MHCPAVSMVFRNLAYIKFYITVLTDNGVTVQDFLRFNVWFNMVEINTPINE